MRRKGAMFVQGGLWGTAAVEFVTVGSRCCRKLSVCYYLSVVLPPPNELSQFIRDVVATCAFASVGLRCGRHKAICYYVVAM